jgi:hypothetical protein
MNPKQRRKMTAAKSTGKPRSAIHSGRKLGKAYLEKLIDEATIDCYDESEQAMGFYTMIEDNLALPFTVTILGNHVSVEKVDIDNRDNIVAVCASGRARQRILILDLPLPDPAPAGSEWIEAYRRWCNPG